MMNKSTEDLSGLSREQIEDLIAKAEEELEELGYERSMTLGGTGVHLGGKEAERLRAEFERDEKRVTVRIAELRSLFQSSSS
jgi:hypothetical protein